MFKGTFDYRIDPKGRVPVPAPFRRSLEKTGETHLVITLLDQCLAVYPASEWERLEQQLLALPSFAKSSRALSRRLASQAADGELDVQGRLLVPPRLRHAVGLERGVSIIGVLNRFEIWAPDIWASFLKDSEHLLDDASLDVAWPPSATEPPSTGKT